MRFLLFRADGQKCMALAEVVINRRATGKGAPGVGICVRGPILWPRRWHKIKNCTLYTKMALRSFAMLQVVQFGKNTIGRGRGQSTSDRRRRARRWNLRSRTNSLAEALAQNQNCLFPTKMMRFLLFRVDGQNFMALAQVDLNRRATGEGARGVGICVRGPIL